MTRENRQTMSVTVDEPANYAQDLLRIAILLENEDGIKLREIAAWLEKYHSMSYDAVRKEAIRRHNRWSVSENSYELHGPKANFDYWIDQVWRNPNGG